VGKLNDFDSDQDGAGAPIRERYTSQSLALLLEVLRRFHADDQSVSSDAGRSDRLPTRDDPPTNGRES